MVEQCAKIANPRVFHLEKSGGGKGTEQGVSNSSIPRHESPIIKAMSRVHESIELPLGDVVVLPSKSAINALAKAAYSNDIVTLESNIRLCCQYKIAQGGRVIHINADPKEQMKHYLVEDTLSLLPKIYPTERDYPDIGDLPALRKNGKLAIVHPLQVGSGVAAIEAPLMEGDRLSFATVVMGMLHDALEDADDGSLAMRNVKFRVGCECRGAEIVDRRGMMDYLVRLYSEYSEEVARSIARGLMKLTRQGIPHGTTKEEYYIHRYLKNIYRSVFCAKVKAEDFHSNSMAIRDIGNAAERLRLARNLIPKGIPQVLAWKKSAWVEYYRLLARLEDLLSLTNEPEYAGILPELMAPSASDIENFERGFVATGSRRFSYQLMAAMPPSGSPVLTYYQTVRDGKLVGEMEIPFCRNCGQAKDIIMSGFHDVRDIDIVQSSNLVQKRLGSGPIYMFDAKEKWNILNKMKDSRKKYDRMLGEGNLGRAFAGFERGRFAEEARRKWGPAIANGSKRLEGFKFYKVQAG